jgi:predicted ATPase
VEWAYDIALAAASPDGLIFAREDSINMPAGGAPEVRAYGSGHRESRFYPERRSLDDARQKALLEDGWTFSYYHFHDTSPAAPIKQGCPIQDNRWLHEDGSNLAAFLNMLRTAHIAVYERIRDTLRMAAPLFDDFVLAPTLLNPNTIQLEWRERGSDMPFFAYQLSDGTLRFLALATALLQPELPGRPHTIVIDEPELGLHPYAITLLAEMIRAASKTTQIIVATQSVTLLDALAEPEEVIVVDRSPRTSGQSTFRRLEPDKLEDWLKEYTLGELWEKNVLGGRP